ncbi:hypothetical protein [Nocardioides sp.]|uniref:hypothetical protein n=1 Tax=Nocardioides sp. TaxID=35761 RepID=UPI00286D31D1|nr:hypothetical protein [Nocardioides sp.]
MRLRRSAAVLLLPLVLLAGCGGDEATSADDPTPTESASPSPTEATSEPPEDAPPAKPQCSEVWVDGQTFPERYKGCLDGERLVQAESTYCEFGTRLFYYANSFYAVPNGPVNETEGALAKDPAFQKAINKCGG